MDKTEHDARRWRVEQGEEVLRNVNFRFFCEQNGFNLMDRCIIGNQKIGHTVWIGNKGISRIV